MANNTIKDHALLSAALEGLELQRARIEEQIREVRSLLGQRAKKAPASAATADEGGSAGPKKRRRRRKLSAEARARIAAAQKKRWNEYRKKKGEN
jgi:hypothetical protein